MADETRDALMMLTIKGAAVPAEGTAQIGDDDMLAKGYVPGTKDNKWQGNFFAVTDFKFEIGLLADTENDPAVIAKKNEERTKQMMEALKEQMANPKLTATRSNSEFARFMDLPPGGSMRAYASDLQPVVITKQFDMTSLTLFNTCVDSTTIDSAVLIKRRGSGQDNLSTYLRVDFTDLLITDMNWDEDDVVTEKVTFICRKAEVQYRIEKESGELGAVLPTQSWSMLNLSQK